MSGYDVFSLVLCLAVFLILGAVSGALICAIVKSRIKLVGYGEYDGQIIEDRKRKKNHSKGWQIVSCVLNAVVCLFFVGVFAFSFYVNCNQDSFSESVPTMRVVLSSSMSKKLEGNDYLTANQLNDQFQPYDIILTYKAPAESELELYDIVVYEVDEQLIVHRIVGIEEPNASHPNERYFTLQGDAVGNIDRFPVKYSQIRGIYRGSKIPFLGGIVLFLQSPAGWLCLLLIVGAVVLAPILEKKIARAEEIRFQLITATQKKSVSAAPDENGSPSLTADDSRAIHTLRSTEEKQDGEDANEM